MKLVWQGDPSDSSAISKHITTRPVTVEAGCGVLLNHSHLDDPHPPASVRDKLSQLGELQAAGGHH